MRVFTACGYLCPDKNAEGKCLKRDATCGGYSFLLV